jgi:hypothetical protein
MKTSRPARRAGLRIALAAAIGSFACTLVTLPATPALAQASGAPGYKVGDRLPADAKTAKTAAFKEINWDNLIPEGWNPADAFRGLDLARLQDGDPRAEAALAKVRELCGEPEVGRVYRGAVTGVKDFGVFVRVMGSIEGLVHVSELAGAGEIGEGDPMDVRVLGTDERGRLKLARVAGGAQ